MKKILIRHQFKLLLNTTNESEYVNYLAFWVNVLIVFLTDNTKESEGPYNTLIITLYP